MKKDRLPKDHATRKQIIEDLDTTFAVEAGAGTGKTALLTSRIVHAVRTGRAKLGEIVAITFTERAANELKVRLRDKLELLLVSAKGREAERLSAALAALDTAHVSTIHSFASELLRERAIEAGVDPGFEIADALRQSLLFEDVWTRWLAEQLADENGPLRPAFLAGLATEPLKEFARFLLSNRDLRPAGSEIAPGDAAKEFARTLVSSAQDLYARMERQCPRSVDCRCAKKIVAAVRAADRFEAARPDEAYALMPSVPKLRLKKPSTRPCYDRERCDAFVRELNDLEGAAGDLRGPAGHAVVLKLADVLGGMAAEYEAAKRERALLDFDDLLLKARDLLRDRKDVRAYFQRRFKMILVDECQDTDPLQIEIALFLAEDGAKASDWRDVEVVPGKLLFVGDPKQSIYRFRRADIETYEEAKQVVARSGKLVEISQNFRSSAPCVAWFNAVFGELIQRPDDGDYQPGYVKLEAWREDANPGVTALKPPDGVVFDSIGEARAAEAAAVAAEIKAMVDRGDTVLDKETDRMRKVTFGDVALLFRTRTAFDIFEGALSGLDVPFRAISGRGFFARQEVAELRVVLKAIERPYDAVAVVAALRTSLLGVSDDELAASAEDGFNYLDRAEDGSYLGKVFRLLAGAHDDRNVLSCSALVQRVLSETKALELFYLKPGGEQRAANLTKVIDAARAYEQTPGSTYGGFVRWLEEMSTAAQEEESPLADEGGDFVKLLTIHKAKGLEFPVVVLADIASSRNPGIAQAIDRRRGAFDIQLGAAGLNLRTIGFDAAKQREQRRQEAEARRLLYVAATRARDRLIIPHFPKGRKAGGYLSYITSLADDVTEELQTSLTVSPADMKPRARRAFRVDVSGKRPKECEAVCEERAKWCKARAELIARAAEPKRLKTASALGGGEYEDFGLPAAEGGLAKAVGTATHAVLEQIDLATGDGLSEVAAEEAIRNGIPDHRPLVERLAENALGMALVKRASAAGKLCREVPFAVCVNGVILEGLIDLAFDDGAGLVIIDYKTDDVAEDRLAEHAGNYRLQIGAYALAAREVFGKLPRSASLLFLRAGREVDVEINEALLDSVRELL